MRAVQGLSTTTTSAIIGVALVSRICGISVATTTAAFCNDDRPAWESVGNEYEVFLPLTPSKCPWEVGYIVESVRAGVPTTVEVVHASASESFEVDRISEGRLTIRCKTLAHCDRVLRAAGNRVPPDLEAALRRQSKSR